MKLFGYQLFAGKDAAASAPSSPSNGKFAFSTPFMNVGSANLSLPFISSYYTLAGVVQFGQDNLYPQLLNQLYYTSPIHGQCIEFITNAVIGGGYSWVDQKIAVTETVKQLTFEKANKFAKMARLLTRDYVIHKRVCVIVRRSKGAITRLERVDPSAIRSNAAGDVFTFSADWARGMYNAKTFPKYSLASTAQESLFVYQDETPGQEIYPIPQYNSCLNFCALDGDIAFFHKNNLQNSIFPSIVIRRPKDFSSIDEMQQFKEEISLKTGASNAGRVLVLTGNGKDDLPEFQAVSANENDKAFEVSSKECKESIAIAHGINPSIMGVKTAGSLGNTEEIKSSYAIFEKNVTLPYREVIEEVLNDLVDIGGIPNTIIINNHQIIEGQIVDKTQIK